MAAEKVFSKNKIIGGKRMSYMKRSISVFIACFMVAALGISGIIAPKAAAASKTPVAVNGQLTLKGTQARQSKRKSGSAERNHLPRSTVVWRLCQQRLVKMAERRLGHQCLPRGHVYS